MLHHGGACVWIFKGKEAWDVSEAGPSWWGEKQTPGTDINVHFYSQLMEVCNPVNGTRSRPEVVERQQNV